MNTKSFNKFYVISALLCIGYFLFQLFYTQYAAYWVDDFWFAHRIYEFKNGIPYKDFSPYKTVLGYYFLLPPILLVTTFLKPLIYTKLWIVFWNSIFLFIAAVKLKKYFSPTAVLLSLGLVLYSNFMLEYSTNIRVDIVAYWLCLFSLLYLLEEKFILAGLLLGLGFFASQKALWHITASDFALGCYWIFFARNRKFFLNILYFNLALLTILVCYIGVAAYFSNLLTVLRSVFYEGYLLYQLDWYMSARQLFWKLIINHDPMFFLLWPVTLISVFVTYGNDTEYRKRFFIIAYTFVVLCELIPYKQIFLYYTIAAMPGLLVLFAAFFSWLSGMCQQLSAANADKKWNLILIGKEGIWGLIIIYLFLLVFLNVLLGFPTPYLLLSVIPITLGIMITTRFNSAAPLLFLFAIVFFGLVYPLLLFVTTIPFRSGEYQRANLIVAQNLLQGEEDYIAGTNFLVTRDQPIPGLQHLSGPALAFLYNQTDHLRAVMLPSLNFDAHASVDSIIQSIKKSSVKLYINNYLFEELPPNLMKFLHAEYMHYWGSIYLYAPTVTSADKKFNLRFSGLYQIITSSPVWIDGKKYFPGMRINLVASVHNVKTQHTLRLKLLPEPMNLRKDFAKDRWQDML